MPTLPNPQQSSEDPSREFFQPFAPNSWKFYIPHTWDQERVTWEDVYLVPTDAAFKGKSIWLTVEASDHSREFYLEQWGCSTPGTPNTEAQAQRSEDFDTECRKHAEDDYKEDQIILSRMGEKKFLIDDDTCTLYVRADNFSREELLEFVLLYLREKGAEFPTLEEAPSSLFSGSNPHAAMVDDTAKIADKIRKESEPKDNSI